MVKYLAFQNKTQWDDFGIANSFEFQILNQCHNTKQIPNPLYVEGGDLPETIATPIEEYLVNVLCDELPDEFKPFELGFEPQYPKAGKLWV